MRQLDMTENMTKCASASLDKFFVRVIGAGF